jgi:hypothetical protein
MRNKVGLISVSLLTLTSANSPALGAVNEDVKTPDRVHSVRILFLDNQSARPDSPALRITRSVIDHIDDRLKYRNKTAVAGMVPSRELSVKPMEAPNCQAFSGKSSKPKMPSLNFRIVIIQWSPSAHSPSASRRTHRLFRSVNLAEALAIDSTFSSILAALFAQS